MGGEVGADHGRVAAAVQVHERLARVFSEADQILDRRTFFQQSAPDDVGRILAGLLVPGGEQGVGGDRAAALENIVVDVDLFRVGIVVRIVDGPAAEYEAVNHDVDVVVAGEVVFEHFDIVVGEHEQSGAGRHIADDGARRGEVGRIVALNPVVEYASRLAALDFQIGQVEHEHAAGVVGGDIVVDVGVS